MDRKDQDSERLNESAARRLLERATELDARLASESSVADLREAARAAGISEEAFNRALAEVRHDAPPLAPIKPVNRGWRRQRAIALVILLGAGLFFALMRRVVPVERAAPATDEAVSAAPRAVAPAPTPAPRASPQPAPTKTTTKAQSRTKTR